MGRDVMGRDDMVEVRWNRMERKGMGQGGKGRIV